MSQMEGDDLEDILQQAELLTADLKGAGELPRIDRNLRQIIEAGNQLWNRTAQRSVKETNDVRASILLGSKGLNLPKISQRLNSLSAGRVELAEPIRETDIQAFIRNERETTILSLLEETRKATFDSVEKAHWETMRAEWDRNKQSFMSAFSSGVGHGELQNVTLPLSGSGGADYSFRDPMKNQLDQTELNYAKYVQKYVDEISSGGIMKPDLAGRFANLLFNENTGNVKDFWLMVAGMNGVQLDIGKDIATVRSSPTTQSSIIAQSLKYLEEHFLRYIDKNIEGNLTQAHLGGIPTLLQKIKSYLNVRKIPPEFGSEDGSFEGKPVWAVVYYSIRCGDVLSALQAAGSIGHGLDELVGWLKEFAAPNSGRRLSPNSESKVKLLYKTKIRNSVDPFKRLVYAVLGRCDVTNDHKEIAEKVEDYLWLKLSLAQPCSVDPADNTSRVAQSDNLYLNDFGAMLVEDYGEKYFSAYQRPFVYFTALFLTGQFEAAIEFLFRIDSWRAHALHAAITLRQLNILNMADSVQAPILSVKNPKCAIRQLNFVRLILMYTSKFKTHNPQMAILYYYFLKDLKDVSGKDVFEVCISELTFETKEFALLVGYVDAEGHNHPGLISRFVPDARPITELIAIESESKGLIEDAVNLYELAGRPEKVVSLLTKRLSQLATPSVCAHSEVLYRTAVEVAARYKTQGRRVSRDSLMSFHLVLDIVTFFDFYRNGSYTEALDVMERLKLVPLNTDQVESKVNNFRHYSDEIRRCIPEILIATMTILYTQYMDTLKSPVSTISSSGRNDGGYKSYLEEVKMKARALISFAGMIPYRMPGDTNARLVSMEVQMN